MNKCYPRTVVSTIAVCFVSLLLSACQLEKVPDVVGDTQSAAAAALANVKLVVGTVTTKASSTVPPGSVISEFPAANSTVVSGSKVDLVVSSGITFGGVVASGYAVASNPGYALDAVTGTQIPFLTDASGNYTVNVYGYAGPFLIHVLGVTTGGSAVNLYSIATTSSTSVNVTPLSDLILGYASGVTTATLEASCTGNLPACPALLNGILANLTSANSAVVAAIPPSVWAAFGIAPATFNAITSQFATTHTGVDGLLDALSIVPPVTTGGAYTVTLTGATATPLVSVPTSGTAGTAGAVPVASPAPTTAAIAQAVNLAAVQGEIQGFFSSLTALFATTQPTAASVQTLLAPTFLTDGANAATWSAYFASSNPVGFKISGGGVAPYSGAQYVGAIGTPPGPAIIYDSNNCVSSIWVYTTVTNNNQLNLIDTIPPTNPAGTCTGGTWQLAGDGKTYAAFFFAEFVQTQSQLSATGARYSQGLKLSTPTNSPPQFPAAAAPYTYVVVASPGLTTVGAWQAGQADLGAVWKLGGALANTTTLVIDPYYGGTNQLHSCADVVASGVGPYSGNPYNSGTPCYDANLVAGSDLGIAFFDASFNLLALGKQRLNLSPATTLVPTSYYPVVTGVSPASASGIVPGATVTVTTTAPASSVNGNVSLGIGTSYSSSINVVPTTTPLTTPFSPGLAIAPANGTALASMGDTIGGLDVLTLYSF